MDNTEDDIWRRAWADWALKRQRCQAPLATEGSGEKRLGTIALFVLTTFVTSAVVTVCVLKSWSSRLSRDGEEGTWNGEAQEEVLRIIGKEVNTQMTRFEQDMHFTLETSSGVDDKGVLIGWRNARYSLSEDRAYAVPSTDYYLIYTCLSFFAPPSGGDVTYWQELWRQPLRGASGDSVLLRDAQTERCRDSESGTEMVFCRRSLIFGILRLRQGDRIYVAASHPQLVSRTNGTSTFGVLRLS